MVDEAVDEVLNEAARRTACERESSKSHKQQWTRECPLAQTLNQ